MPNEERTDRKFAQLMFELKESKGSGDNGRTVLGPVWHVAGGKTNFGYICTVSMN